MFCKAGEISFPLVGMSWVRIEQDLEKNGVEVKIENHKKSKSQFCNFFTIIRAVLLSKLSVVEWWCVGWDE